MSGDLGDLGFAPENEPDVPKWKPLPVGDYIAEIVQAERTSTKDGTGELLKLTVEIAEGEYFGQKVIDRLNLWNRKPETVLYARGTLKKICQAVGWKGDLRNTVDLLKKKMVITVAIERNGQFEGNAIKRYEPLQAATPPAAGYTPPSTSAGGAPNWKRST